MARVTNQPVPTYRRYPSTWRNGNDQLRVTPHGWKYQAIAHHSGSIAQTGTMTRSAHRAYHARQSRLGVRRCHQNVALTPNSTTNTATEWFTRFRKTMVPCRALEWMRSTPRIA